MTVKNMLYSYHYPINEHISIKIPKVGEIIEREGEYYGMVSLITSTPYDMMVQLDDIGVDFTKINDYELFLLIFSMLKSEDTTMIFGELDLNQFESVINEQNDMIVLKHKTEGWILDRAIHGQICAALRKIHRLQRNNRKPGNNAAKQYMLERAREKMKRRRNRVRESQLEELIVALVNTEQFSYGFEGVKELSIYQFNESLHQVIKKIDFDNRMYGIYAGTINAKDVSQDDLNWLTHK